MSAAGDMRRQAAMLVKLRQMRMDTATRALASARAAREKAGAARRVANQAASEAEAARDAAHSRLIDDPQEAERLLAVVDQARFRQSIANEALHEAEQEERDCAHAETLKRHAAIVARARHAGVEERARTIARRIAQRREERAQSDFEDRRVRR